MNAMTEQEIMRRLVAMGSLPATALEKKQGESEVEKTSPATDPASVEKTPSPESLKKDAMGDYGLDASELMARLTKVEKKDKYLQVSPAAQKFVDELCKFASEWKVDPSPRLVSTFVQAAKVGTDFARNFFVSRFALSQELNDCAAAVEETCKSKEFEKLVATALPVRVKKTVNARFAVFYGKPGSGKSTFAKAQFPTAGHYFCSEDRRAIDLISEVALDFESGKKGFVPSTIARAMEDGRPVILDEINLLDSSTLCTIQSMTDETDSIEVAGNRYVIRPGFCIIGTMNLETGMGLRPLPDALVDRACVLRHFAQPSTTTRAAWAGLI